MGTKLESTDAKNKLEDLSGVVIQPGENPYKALIGACNDDPVSHVSFVVEEKASRAGGECDHALSSGDGPHMYFVENYCLICRVAWLPAGKQQFWPLARGQPSLIFRHRQRFSLCMRSTG